MTTRRGFLQYGSALLCACATPVSAAARQGRFPKFSPGLVPTGYADVSLSAGRLQTQLTHQHGLFMAIDNDRLLKPFRVRAGLPAPGEDMGGWYDASDDFHIDPNDWSTANWHGYIPGHSFGQYMSGLARAYTITGDPATKAKVASMVRDYIPTISPKFYEGYPLPAYTYDKIVIGLIDAWHHCGVTEAKTALDLTTDAVLPYLPEKALTREERRARPYTQEAEIWDEPYTLPEHLFQAWKLGMGDRYKDMAVRYLQDEALFDPLAKGVSPLKGKHAYSHVNALNSAVEAYYVTGDNKYLKAAINGFDFVSRQSYATGGWGPNEELVAADDNDTLYNMLTETHRSFETPCGAYGHFKITRSLLGITKDSRYGDSMERVLYNTVLGAKPTNPDGDTFYYSDYSDTATKFFRGEKWPCCSGTFIQVAADYGISAYLRDRDDVYVNLYLASELKGKPLSLVQVTDYPLNNTSRIEITEASRTRSKVFLRIPEWSGPATEVRVNGQPVAGKITSGTFLRLDRVWQKGDVVEISFDMGLRLEPLNAAHADMVAVMTGPIVLFPTRPANTPSEAPMPAATWLTAERRTTETWAVATPGGEIVLKPFMAISDETYRLYSRVRI